MKRSVLLLAGVVLVLLTVVSGCGRSAKKAAEAADKARADSIAAVQRAQDSLKALKQVEKKKVAAEKFAKLPAEPVFDIITNYGTMRVKLYSKTPKHRDNFAKLALEGYYDGLLFHRVINGFMIQGGDPLTRDTTAVSRYGTGGPDYKIPAEFVPEYRHAKGALAAARQGDRANPYKESSGSQFYIVQSPEACAQLDGAYTVFGQTVSGLDVIDKIATVRTYKNHPPQPNDLPVKPVEIVEIKLVEE
jgi:cyclophilin family peptidyl-prolyl cis-trans isomerase